MLVMNQVLKRRLLYLVPVASTRLYFSNSDCPVRPPACSTILCSRFGLFQHGSDRAHIHQVHAPSSSFLSSPGSQLQSNTCLADVLHLQHAHRRRLATCFRFP